MRPTCNVPTNLVDGNAAKPYGLLFERHVAYEYIAKDITSIC